MIGAPALEQFTRLARLHGDGWGTAWFDDTQPTGTGQRTYRSLRPTHSDPVFAEQTDSERYFPWFARSCDASPETSPPRFARSVQLLRSSFPIASLSALMLSDTEFIIVHASSIEDAPIPDQLPPGDCALPEHLDACYLMRWRRTADGTLAYISSGLPDDGWIPSPTTQSLESISRT